VVVTIPMYLQRITEQLRKSSTCEIIETLATQISTKTRRTTDQSILWTALYTIHCSTDRSRRFGSSSASTVRTIHRLVSTSPPLPSTGIRTAEQFRRSAAALCQILTHATLDNPREQGQNLDNEMMRCLDNEMHIYSGRRVHLIL
jgi:ribosomal protein S7